MCVLSQQTLEIGEKHPKNHQVHEDGKRGEVRQSRERAPFGSTIRRGFRRVHREGRGRGEAREREEAPYRCGDVRQRSLRRHSHVDREGGEEHARRGEAGPRDQDRLHRRQVEGYAPAYLRQEHPLLGQRHRQEDRDLFGRLCNR